MPITRPMQHLIRQIQSRARAAIYLQRRFSQTCAPACIRLNPWRPRGLCARSNSISRPYTCQNQNKCYTNSIRTLYLSLFLCVNMRWPPRFNSHQTTPRRALPRASGVSVGGRCVLSALHASVRDVIWGMERDSEAVAAIVG